MLYAAPVSDFLTSSSAQCHLTRLPSKTDLAGILSGAKWRAVSGTLLKRAALHLVESQALTRVAAISYGDHVAA